MLKKCHEKGAVNVLSTWSQKGPSACSSQHLVLQAKCFYLNFISKELFFAGILRKVLNGSVLF